MEKRATVTADSSTDEAMCEADQCVPADYRDELQAEAGPKLTACQLLQKLCIMSNGEDSNEYQRKVKWIITGVVAVAAATSPMGASIFYRTSNS